jgi:hypothetical protein
VEANRAEAEQPQRKPGEEPLLWPHPAPPEKESPQGPTVILLSFETSSPSYSMGVIASD